MMEEERINWVNGIWEDGEWISFDEVHEYIESEDAWDEELAECNVQTPTGLELWRLLHGLVQTARSYLEVTGRHLPIYGEMGELYGEIWYGIKRHKPHTQGSDGKMGNDFVEIKTISPHKSNDTVQVKRAGNFNKLLIVKICEDFQFKSRLIDRKDLKKGDGKYARVKWQQNDD